MMLPNYLDVKAVAKLLHVSVTTARMEMRKMPHLERGGMNHQQLLVEEGELLRYLNRLTVAGKPLPEERKTGARRKTADRPERTIAYR